MSVVGDDSETGSQDDASWIQSESVSSEEEHEEAALHEQATARAIVDDNHHEDDFGGQYEDSDLDDGDDDRENRFAGPSSTWRFFTEDERGLAASLEQQQANDLALHLYSAHALKARVRHPDAASNVRPHQSKKRWVKLTEDGSSPWYPDVAWTQWPMNPEDVPRRREEFGVSPANTEDDAATYKKTEPWRPSAELEDVIKALILKQAKKQFRERPRNHLSQEGRLDLLVDEDEIDALLDPTVCHILSRFDDLLFGLQQNRQGHASNRSGTRPQTTSKKQRRSSSIQDIPRMKRESSDTDDVGISPISDDDNLGDTRAREGKKPIRRRPLNPRDWSEVIGIASLTGWKSNVVNRAAKRCTSLFGEEMVVPKVLQPTENQPADEARMLALEKDKLVEEPIKLQHRCPIVRCQRHAKPFDKAWRWREHLKRSHEYSSEQVQEVEDGMMKMIEVAIR